MTATSSIPGEPGVSASGGSDDPLLRGLTDEQVVAAGTTYRHVFLESAPGSGKTAVAALRFGVQRYSLEAATGGGHSGDPRGVLAVSFTRAATWELHRRVRRFWGSTALAWPHRIVTLDTLMCELLHYLLAVGLLRWPGGHTTLLVEDTWKVVEPFVFTRAAAAVRVNGPRVFVARGFTKKGSLRPEPNAFENAIEAGRCTHDEVRYVLEKSLRRPEVADAVRAWLVSTVRALIVDEVFDANTLDLAVLELAVQAGVDVNCVGDPWQALYGFRGATPDEVPSFLERTGMTTLPLSESFRWKTDEQRELADSLRRGSGVVLPGPIDGIPPAEVNVVLGCRWQQLWDVGDHILPLAFGSAKGNNAEAAATLLLNQLCSTVHGEHATYLADALTTLGVTNPDVPKQLEEPLTRVLDQLAGSGRNALNATYNSLVDVMKNISRRQFKPAHANYTKRLALLRRRLMAKQQLTLAMTTHQAKGREWDAVGIALNEEERTVLHQGLRRTEESHRQLYVACTRARYQTIEA